MFYTLSLHSSRQLLVAIGRNRKKFSCSCQSAFQPSSNYVQWIYHRRFDAPEDRLQITRLISASVLGDVLQDGHFRDAIIDQLAAYNLEKKQYLRRHLAFIYDNTKQDDKLRSLAIDTVVYTGSTTNWIKSGREKNDVSNDTLWDLLARHREAESKLKPSDAPFSSNTCDYHIHQDGVATRPNTNDVLAKGHYTKVWTAYILMSGFRN